MSARDVEASRVQKLEAWENVQKKGYARWCNTYLAARGEKIDDFAVDFKDGIKLIHLVEELSGYPVGRYNKNPRMDIQRHENIGLALKFLKEHERIKLVNIGEGDIHMGSIKIILALVWNLILKYQIGKSAGEHKEENFLDRLIAFVNAQIQPYGLEPIHNLTTSFSDGRVLSALTDSLERGYIDVKAPGEPLQATTKAMEVALKHHQIPYIIDPEDMIKNPDKNSMMTYVSYFMERALAYRKNRAYAPNCTASGDGLEGGYDNTGHVFTLHARTIEGGDARGGEADRIVITLRPPGAAVGGPEVVYGEAIDNADGTYTIGYPPLPAGDYELNVLVYNEPIKGMPTSVKIVPFPTASPGVAGTLRAVGSAGAPETSSTVPEAESTFAIETGVAVVTSKGHKLEPARVTITTSSVVTSGCVFQGHPITLGPGTLLHPCVTILAAGGPVRIGSNNIFEENCIIENPVMADGSVQELVIGDWNLFEVGSQIASRRIGDANVFECKASLGEESVIGSGCRVGACVTVGADEIVPDGTVLYTLNDGGRGQRTRVAGDAVERHKEEMRPKLNLLKTLLRPTGRP